MTGRKLLHHATGTLVGAESLARSPIPTRSVSSDEFLPMPQTPRQREFEARVQRSGALLAKRYGLSRRAFFRTASDMAAAFAALNDTFGPLFGVGRAEAQTPEPANERGKQLSTHPYRLDDEKLLYPAYEKFARAGICNVCIHKGLYSPATAKRFPNLLPYADVRDVGKAARDWPQLNFIIYHSAYRWAGGALAEDGWKQFEQTGRIEWVTDLAEIPAKFGVSNVYADLGRIFAQSTIAEPRLSAVMIGQLIKGLGADHVCWGTDAIWTGAPQWQIEALRRIEIPEALQKKYGYAPLGPADGAVKNAILGGNNARLYNLKPAAQAAFATDKLALAKTAYEREGSMRTNLVYGYAAG